MKKLINTKQKIINDNILNIHSNELNKKIISLQTQVNKLKNLNKNLKDSKKTTQKSESIYHSLFELSDDSILVIENEKFVDCNRAVVKMLGYKSKEELLNTHPSELSPLKQPDGRLSFEKAEEMIALAIKNGSHHFEWIHTKANGEPFPVEVWLCSLKHNNRILINTIWRDLTKKKESENIIHKNIAEKEILLKEIHHRVKNNLQIICSLLNLQSNTIGNPRLQAVLEQSKYRVESMAKVHEMLYKANDISRINFFDYVLELVNTLIYSVKGNRHKVNLKLDINEIYFTINTAIPLGLLINEIVTNSLKHGIKDDDKGQIVINIRTINNTKHEMLIGDDGIGYKNSFSEKNLNSLGFQIISSVVDQVNGTIVKENSTTGTYYKIIFESE